MVISGLHHQLDKIHAILLTIKNKFHNLGQPQGSASPIKEHMLSQSDDLVRIS